MLGGDFDTFEIRHASAASSAVITSPERPIVITPPERPIVITPPEQPITLRDMVEVYESMYMAEHNDSEPSWRQTLEALNRLWSAGLNADTRTDRSHVERARTAVRKVRREEAEVPDIEWVRRLAEIGELPSISTKPTPEEIAEQTRCYLILYPTSSFATNRRTKWHRFKERHSRLKLKYAHLPPLHSWREHSETKRRFGYTDAEAKFCGSFDWCAASWARKQQQLVEQFDDEACAVCKERRPSWMTSLRVVSADGDGDGSKGWLHDELQAGKISSEMRDVLLRRHAGQRLCARCRQPNKEECRAGILRFSSVNCSFACLPPFDSSPFATAWEAEIALVRLTIPCIEIKVLKHGGTLSKTHSVCVPNKVERIASLPRLASESGVVWYTKPGKRGTTRKFQVRPKKVHELCQWLSREKDAQGNVLPAGRVYRGGYIKCTRELGGEGDAIGIGSWQTDETPRTLEFPLLEYGEDVVEDTGPAPAQNAQAEGEDDNTSSGFCAVLPAPDVQASIEQALQDAAAVVRGDASSTEEPRQSEPVYRVSGEQQPISEWDPYYFVMAFPEIFLTGQADLGADRPVEIPLADWLEHLMWADNQRAARHKVFPFVAYSFLQRHRAMSQGSFFVNVCVNRDDSDTPASVEDLNERIGHGDNSLAQSVYYWGSNITGSDAHLASLKREIDAIISDQLTREEPNPPSLFLSASCAEFHWHQLLAYLAQHVFAVEGAGADGCNARWREAPTAEEFQALRRQKLNEYTHIVTTFFEQRADGFLKEVLLPMLDIDVYYMIFEFADGRGQIHFHLLAWLKRRAGLHTRMHVTMPPEFGEGTAKDACDAWADEPLLGAGRPPNERIVAQIESASSDDAASQIDARCEIWNAHLWTVLGADCTDDDRQRAFLHAVRKGVMLDRTSSALPGSLRATAVGLPESLKRRAPPADANGGEAVKEEDERLKLSWKALLLEAWMRERNFRADHPVDEPSAWPAPEGCAPEKSSPLTVERIEVISDGGDPARLASDMLERLTDKLNFCKTHRCRRSYCLCKLRSSNDDYRECAKGGFGPEAPLLNHKLEGPMRPCGGSDGGEAVHRKGRAMRYDVDNDYYMVSLNPDDLLVQGDNGAMYICKTADARPVDEQTAAQCKPKCQGRWTRNGEVSFCNCAPPMGKPRRKEPAIEQRRGILTIELPRTHPRKVQGIHVVTEWWLANDDQSIILCRSPPEEATADELAEVACYVPGYMCKGGSGSSAYAALFKSMVSKAESDTSVKTLVRRLLIRIVGKDFPRQQVLYHLAGDQRNAGLMRRTNVQFKRVSLSSTRRLKPNERDGTALEQSIVDKYTRRAAKDEELTLYEYAKGDNCYVPLVSGGHLFTNPQDEKYCLSMLKLHRKWRTSADLLTVDMTTFATALEAFAIWRELPSLPRLIRVELKKLEKRAPSEYQPLDKEAQYEYEDAAAPEWVDLLGNAEYTEAELDDWKFDNFTARPWAHDEARGPNRHMYGRLLTEPRRAEFVDRWWQDQVDQEEARRAASTAVHLFDDDPTTANEEQWHAIVLVLHLMHWLLEGEANAWIRRDVPYRVRRLLLLGEPGAGKSFVLRCIATLIRMLTNLQDAALVGGPNGVAAFQARGTTWHSLLNIPTGAKFARTFDGDQADARVQERLRNVDKGGFLGDEISMTGRMLKGWIANKIRLNVARGTGSSEPLGGGKLPLFVAAGDFAQVRQPHSLLE